MNGAIGIFAKTADLSPVKTRLAETIGVAKAKAFYALSVAATAEIVQLACAAPAHNLTPFWALAEEDALARKQWQDFACLWTGEGGLGQRLHHIYSTLYKQYDYVMLIGTDSPQLSLHHFELAITTLRDAPDKVVMGGAEDGGFYLCGAARHIPPYVWTGVQYSQSTTRAELSAALAQNGIETVELLSLRDIDTEADLIMLRDVLADMPRTHAQTQLYDWICGQYKP